MSLWDNFKNSVDNMVFGPSRAVEKVTNSLTNATKPYLDKQQAILAKGKADYAIGGGAAISSLPLGTQMRIKQESMQMEDPLTEPFLGVVTSLDEKVYQPFFKGLGVAGLLANPDTYAPQDDEYTNGVSRAWGARDEISLGQSTADIYAAGANLLPDIGALAELNNVDINIYDKEMRERIYSRMRNEAGQRVDSSGNVIPEGSWAENLFRNISGGADVTKQAVFDPLFGIGLVAKGARVAKLDNFRPEAIVNTAEWAAEQGEFAATTFRASESKLRLLDIAPELNRSTSVLDDMTVGVMADEAIRAEVNLIRETAGKSLIDETEDTSIFIEDYRSYVKAQEEDLIKNQAIVDVANSAQAPKPTLATGVSQFVEQIVTRQMTWQEIAAHRTLRDFGVDSEFLSYALAEAAKKGEGAVTDVLLLAQGSDPGAYFRLMDQNNDLMNLIDSAQVKFDDLETSIQKATDANDPTTRARIMSQQNKLSQEIKSLRAENTYLDRLVNTENSLEGSLTGIPVSNSKLLSPVIENYRANKAIVKAGLIDGSLKPISKKGGRSAEFDWTRVQKSPLHKPVYVAQWIGHKLNRENPSGFVTVDGLDRFDGVTELRTYLDNTPGLDNKIAEKNAFMDSFVGANTADERREILGRVEMGIVRDTARFHGLDDTMVKNITNADDTVSQMPMWEFVYKQFQQERARAVAQFKKDKVYGVDQNQTLLANPVVESQLEYSVPMLNTNALDQYFGDMSLNKSVWQATAANSRKIKDEWLMPTWSTVDRLWRGNVLIRLGYPQRNILTEWLLLAQHDVGFSKIVSVGNVATGTRNFASNRYNYLKDYGARYQAALDVAQSNPQKAAATLRALTPKQHNWGYYEQYAADNIKMLQEQRDGILELFDDAVRDQDTLGVVTRPTETIDFLNSRIAVEEERLAQIALRVQAKGERFGKQKTLGQMSIKIGPYEFAGVHEGPQGLAARNLISSGGRVAFDSSPINTAVREMGLVRSGNYGAISPLDDSYFTTLATIVNQQFRGSRTAMKVINGESDEAILAYLATPEGKSELKKLKWTEITEEKVAGHAEPGVVLADPAENYLQFVRKDIIELYLPNDAMLQLAKERLAVDSLGRGKGIVTSADLRLASRDTELNTIHGELLEDGSIWQNRSASSFQKIDQWISEKIFKRVFTWIGEFPEDAAVSTPFGMAVYNSKLTDITETWISNGISPTNKQVLQAQTIARKFAVKESRDYLYRVVRQSTIGDSIPLLAPFYQAQQSTARRAGKLAYRNPDKTARIIYLWNTINTNATQDEEGNRFLIFTIPPSWYDDKGLSSVFTDSAATAIGSQDQLKWNVNSLNLLLAGLRMEAPNVLEGQTEGATDAAMRYARAGASILGIGPAFQMPASAILKNNPALDEAASEALGFSVPARGMVELFAPPFPSDTWYAPLLSAWNRRAISMIKGDSLTAEQMDKDFERTQLVMFLNHKDKIRTGENQPMSADPLKNDELLFKQASEEASSFLALRLAVNLLSGFIPSNEGEMTPWVKLYRSYQEKHGAKAYETFLMDYPDMGFMAVSMSKNLSGSSSDTGAVFMREKYNDSIEKALKATGLTREESLSFVQMVTTRDIGADVLYDPYSSFKQKKSGDRIQLTAEQGYENQQIREGWNRFFIDTKEYEDELAKRGFSRYSNRAKPLNAERKKRLKQIGKEMPLWWNRYSLQSSGSAAIGYVRAMKVILADDEFMKNLPEDSFWLDIESIMEERDALVKVNDGRTPPDSDLELYAKNIAPYLTNETTNYFYLKFLDGDTFGIPTVE